MIHQLVSSFKNSYCLFESMKASDAFSYLMDTFQFAFGFVGAHTLLTNGSLKERDISVAYASLPGWQSQAYKIADFCASSSLVCRSLTTSTALLSWKWLSNNFLSSKQIETLLTIEKKLPGASLNRSLKVIAFLLGVPATLKTLHSAYSWLSSVWPKPSAEPLPSTVIQSPRRDTLQLTDCYLSVQTARTLFLSARSLSTNEEFRRTAASVSDSASRMFFTSPQ